MQKLQWSIALFLCGLLFFPIASFAKDYNIKVRRLEPDLYKIQNTQYVIHTSMCNVKPKRKQSKDLNAKLSISLVGNRITFEGRKAVCTVVKIYKEHKGELEGL